jgi:ribonuclease HI
MEMLACIEALKTLEEPSNVLLCSDSQLVIKCAMGAWKRKPRLVGSAQPIP